jgi:hypothetical protein
VSGFYGPHTFGRVLRGKHGSLLVLCLLGSVACHDERPRSAAGFRLEGLSKLSIGMTTAEIRQAMGEPLPELSPGSSKKALWYARPGARWFLGEYRSRVRGHECILWLKDGRLMAVRVFDAEAAAICECREGACKAGWAEPCVQGQRTMSQRP